MLEFYVIFRHTLTNQIYIYLNNLKHLNNFQSFKWPQTYFYILKKERKPLVITTQVYIHILYLAIIKKK